MSSNAGVDFGDPLEPVEASIYREAEERYVEAVSPRTSAIYRVGEVTHPGISGVDLMVVPMASWVENARYFSAQERLSPHLAKLFRRSPLVLPPARPEAIRYTTLSNPRLISGKDELGAPALDVSRENHWSLVLEGYLHFRRFVTGCEAAGGVTEARLMTRASALRHSLLLLDRVLGTTHGSLYEERLAALRGGFFSREPRERSREAWELTRDGCATLQRTIREQAGEGSEQSASRIAGDVLRKTGVLPGLDPVGLEARRRCVRRHYAALRRLRFVRGAMFFSAAYRKLYRKGRDSVELYEAANPQGTAPGS